MAIEFVSLSSGRVSGVVAPITVARPAGADTGDVLFMVAARMASSTITIPVGWTLKYQAPWSAGGNQYRIGYRVITDIDTEPVSYDVGNGVISSVSAVIYCYRGVDMADPFAMMNTPGTTNATTSETLSGTTTKNNALILFAHISQFTGANGIGTPPAGFTLRGGRTADQPLIHLADAVQEVAGATGNKTITWPSATNRTAFMIALAPLVASASGPHIVGNPVRAGAPLRVGSPARVGVE